MIEAGLVDAAIVGGVDSLCLTTLYGFNSLELLAPEPCRPYDSDRNGLSIGEAAAFILLQRPADSLDADAVLRQLQPALLPRREGHQAEPQAGGTRRAPGSADHRRRLPGAMETRARFIGYGQGHQRNT